MAEKTTLDKEIEEAKALCKQEKAAKDKHAEELAKIDFNKQFLVRDKIAQVLILLKELGFRSIEDDRGNTVLDINETDMRKLTGKA